VNAYEDFGLIDLSDFEDEDDVVIPPIPKDPCTRPSYHVFKQKMLATHYYWECTLCGYSPELDGSKPKFEDCHKEYIKWKKDNAI